ncbi:glutaredoxin family protein [Methanobacterium alkalithermotolerans]|uniref:Glutaredoxin family protein n=1 Tax=Methanobacterium alkalithermotolerans TaxID=2731220 RepID=A0A8T8K4T6_9EURY|nr:glutaredoxin family protein [Methanobacterium alkalithermotolerans]QUH23568.1 glutaredoxin family protein [Methanobacterium alkalithermotolerans]RJS48031.1 MAG: NrdH-redoxin [Methanobacterium sp.]
MALEHVDGHKKGEIILFALSTCGWCKKTKLLLDELGVSYDYIYVDLTRGSERDETLENLKKWNPSLSFPTLVINNERAIIGFDRTSIEGALG